MAVTSVAVFFARRYPHEQVGTSDDGIAVLQFRVQIPITQPFFSNSCLMLRMRAWLLR